MPKKRSRSDADTGYLATLAGATLTTRSRVGCSGGLAVEILEAIRQGSALPSRARARGPEFEPIDSSSAFQGVVKLEHPRLDRLHARGAAGAAVLKQIRACEEVDEDIAHWSGPDAELLYAIARDDLLEPRIRVMRAVNPFNPVALFTPPTEEPLAAVAAEPIDIGEPIAMYLGDLTMADDPCLCGGINTYLYELDKDELEQRGYTGNVGLRMDASRAGGEARFIKYATPIRTGDPSGHASASSLTRMLPLLLRVQR